MASILFFVIFLFITTTAHGLKCYGCDSQDNVSCKWGLLSLAYHSEECPSIGLLDALVSPKCFKITAQNKEGESYVARGCLPPGAIGCSTIAKAVGWISSASSNDPHSLSDLSCETCESDYCNSASKVTGFLFIGFLLSTIAFLF